MLQSYKHSFCVCSIINGGCNYNSMCSSGVKSCILFSFGPQLDYVRCITINLSEHTKNIVLKDLNNGPLNNSDVKTWLNKHWKASTHPHLTKTKPKPLRITDQGECYWSLWSAVPYTWKCLCTALNSLQWFYSGHSGFHLLNLCQQRYSPNDW